MERERIGPTAAVVYDIDAASLRRGPMQAGGRGPAVVSRALLDVMSARRAGSDGGGEAASGGPLAEARRIAGALAGWDEGAEPSPEALAEVLRAVVQLAGSALEQLAGEV